MHTVKAYGQSKGMTVLILNLLTGHRWAVSLTLQPLYPQAKCP